MNWLSPKSKSGFNPTKLNLPEWDQIKMFYELQSFLKPSNLQKTDHQLEWLKISTQTDNQTLRSLRLGEIGALKSAQTELDFNV
jgi:hypothetical protein